MSLYNESQEKDDIKLEWIIFEGLWRVVKDIWNSKWKRMDIAVEFLWYTNAILSSKRI